MNNLTINIFLALFIFPLMLTVYAVMSGVVIDWHSLSEVEIAIESHVELRTIGILALSTLLGIICGTFYKNLGRNSEQDTILLSEVKAILRSRTLWRSLIASPVVCGVVISTTRGNQDIILAIIFAFENGFFCTHVLYKQESLLRN